MDLTARIKEANAQGKPPLDIHVLPHDKHWHKLLHSLNCRAEAGDGSGTALAVIENLENPGSGAGRDGKRAVASDSALVSSGWGAVYSLPCRSTGRKWPA